MNLLRSQTNKILVESHRGAEALAPENTWTAILAGAEAGADLLELDVQITSDGIPVIYHKYRIPGGAFLPATKYNVIAQLDAGDGQAPPRLDEVLVWAKHQSQGLMLDVKNGFGIGVAMYAQIIKAIEEADAIEQVMVAGLDHIGLLWAKRHLPNLTTCLLMRGMPIDLVAMAKRTEVDAISLNYDLIQRADVEALHEAGIAVTLSGLWEPNFRYAAELGVDIVAWGDPAEAIFALEALGMRAGK